MSDLDLGGMALLVGEVGERALEQAGQGNLSPRPPEKERFFPPHASRAGVSRSGGLMKSTHTSSVNGRAQSDTIASSLSVNEVAQCLQVDQRTVRRYILSGWSAPNGSKIRLAAQRTRGKTGYAWRIQQADLDDFQRKIATSEQATGTVGVEQVGQAGALSAREVFCELRGELERTHCELCQVLEANVRLTMNLEMLASRYGDLAGEIAQLRLLVESRRTRSGPRKARSSDEGGQPRQQEPQAEAGQKPPADQPNKPRRGCAGQLLRWIGT